MKRVLYVQYTDPAGYPPLEHSTRLFSEIGWQVRHLGVKARGAAKALALPVHATVDVKLKDAPAGGLQTALHYARFLSWCRSEIRSWRPDVVYCSDVRSYPVGLWASWQSGVTTILHEHDPPASTGGGRTMQALRAARVRFARGASLTIIPQDERAQTFLADTGADPNRLRVVHNCPARRDLELQRARPPRREEGLALWYHGALGAGQLPPAIIEALARLPGDVRLEIAGYETVSNAGYVDKLRQRASELAIGDRVKVHGVIPLRDELLRKASGADIGLCLFAEAFRDPMVGASNKPFDYLACGLPLLTNRTPEWQDFFGREGVSINCDPLDADDIARAVIALREDPDRRSRMARTGQRLIETRWNYETQFAPVLQMLGTQCCKRFC